MTSDSPITNFDFPAAYHAEVLAELPGRGSVVELSREGRTVDGGVLFEVISAGGNVWCGLAANGPETVGGALSGLYSTPSPTRLCVVARGAAYLVEADGPEGWEVVPDFPVVAVASAVADRRLVLATPQHVLAVDDSGIAWQSSRLAADGIELGGTADGWIAGIADPSGVESRVFRVNLATGGHAGGFTFEPPGA